MGCLDAILRVMPFPFRHALLVANPIAGACRGKAAAAKLQQALTAAGLRATLMMTGGAGDARRFARERAADVDVMVSIGGDGTLREILDGLHGEAADKTKPCPPIATYPMGTANVLAIDFELPTKIPGIVEVIRGGATRGLSLARISHGDGTVSTSFLAVGAGLDAEVVHRLDSVRTGAMSKLSYVPHVIRTVLGYRPPQLTVTIDGEQLDGTYGQVLMANIINYGGFLRLDPDTKSDDDEWEVYLWRRGNRRELTRAALRGFLKSLPGGPCTMRRARKVEITSQSTVPYHVDGDAAGQTPLAFQVTGECQAVLVPAQSLVK
jgi:diacylglycerol kinase (ATP)